MVWKLPHEYPTRKVSENKKKTKKMTINNVVLTSNAEENLLGIIVISELKFEKHITRICNKASQKIQTLFRITGYVLLINGGFS